MKREPKAAFITDCRLSVANSRCSVITYLIHTYSCAFPNPAPQGEQSSYAGKLNRFVNQLRPSLTGVTQLILEVQFARQNSSRGYIQPKLDKRRPTATAASQFLVPLAECFPNLRSLCLGGDIGRFILQAFEASCKQLTSLEILPRGITLPTLDDLHLLLPRLTSFALQASGVPDTAKAHISIFHTACLLPLLTSISVPGVCMDSTLWNTLPPNLKELCVESFDLELECYAWNELEDSPMYGTSGSDVSDELFVENTSTEGNSTENNSGTEVNSVVEDPGSEAAGGSEEESDVQVLSHLRHMAVSRLEHDIPVECLAAAVSLAPNLETAIFGSAAAACMTDPVTGKTLDSRSPCVDAIAYLDKRMRAGLTISAAKAASNTCAEQSFALHLHVVESGSKLYHGIVYGCPKERVVCGFLRCLPDCATMTRLAITTAALELERQMEEEAVVGLCEQPHQY